MKVIAPILSICIPTYNRAKDLKKNLSLLESYFQEYQDLKEKVVILISNNHSSDNTEEVATTFVKSEAFNMEYYCQEKNIGGEHNTMWLVEKATTPWIMTLGDDDYLEPWYIAECLKQISEHPILGCIIPNYIAYYPETDTYGDLREELCETQYYKAGFDACLQNAWRGHQLSGLCFRRESVMEEFRKRKMDNPYPQIFFIAYNALRYDVLHFGQKCLAVSGIPQAKKDWGYGNDGLVNGIFENFKNLGVTSRQRALLEAHFLKVDPRYLWAANDINRCIEHILKGNNVSFLGRYYIAKNILHERCYTGKKLRIWFYLLARFVLLKQLLTGKPISL